MSSITLWLAAVAVVLVALFLVNALVYRRRHGSFLPRASSASERFLGPLSKAESLAVVLFLGMLLAAKAAPYLAPASSFTLWLGEPYAYVVYLVWAWMLPTILVIMVRVAGALRTG